MKQALSWSGPSAVLSKRTLCADTPLIYNVAAIQVVQFILHVVDILIDLLHSLAVPYDLILVNLGGEIKAQCCFRLLVDIIH